MLVIADADIEPPPSFGAKLRNDFVSAMGKINEAFVIILDIEHVLSIGELSMLTGVNDSDIADNQSDVKALPEKDTNEEQQEVQDNV